MTKIYSPKKLIEVALPLDDINVAAAREKSIRHGHPSTLHLWWARRPLAAARAVIFAQMVNDPGYQQDQGFKYGVNKRDAEIKREKLFQIIRDLVKWENTNNEAVLNRAREAIKDSWRETCHLNRNHPQAAALFDPEKLPAFHDPFAGGGSIPLEAQRLGLESYASDLNPVAVMINKAMIEIPPKFAGQAPVGPIPESDKTDKKRSTQDGFEDWAGAKGLAEDVRRYGHWMRDEAFKRIGHLYPKVMVTAEMIAGSVAGEGEGARDARGPSHRKDLKPYEGQELTVIAWLWARTVKSPSPAFSHVDVPLVSSFVLSSKKGKEAWVEPVINGDSYRFEVRVGVPPLEAKNGTKLGRGTNFNCIFSDSPIQSKYIYSESQSGRLGNRLMAVVAEGKKGRIYLTPNQETENIARTAQPDWRPEALMPNNPRWFSPPMYGMKSYGDLFTPRQLVALTTFSDLVQEAREKVIADYLGARASRTHKSRQDNRTSGEWHSRGYLPHWEAGEVPQSITFRLHDSLPATIRQQWAQELKTLSKDAQELERRKRIEAALDAGYGACWLQREDIAEIVEQALLYFDKERYQLHAWVIMPNHVHLLMTPLQGYTLSSITHSIKSFTAKEANKRLQRQGAFWMEEYYDRVIRDDNHFNAVVAYIHENPVKAGLCNEAAAWRFGSGSGSGSAGILPAKEERAGRPRSQDPLAEGGCGATAYGDAVAVYLAFAIDKLADKSSTIAWWINVAEKMAPTFSRQAIPMVWDYAEMNPFCNVTSNFIAALTFTSKAVSYTPAYPEGLVYQADAATQIISQNKVISTDPPYYDNIGYADLSDFFYVWMRRSLRSFFPTLFATMAVPKAEELVATPYRHGSKKQAEQFFLSGMTKAIHNMAKLSHNAFPISIYYAFKSSETKLGNTSSAGWETFLDAVIIAGFSIVGTWPVRTERSGGLRNNNQNALASSIVLVCQKRPDNANTTTRRDFQRELREKMPEALEAMIGGETGTTPIQPVDLAQAAIGPGMAIYTKYKAVLNQDGSTMSVHDALILINRAITDYLNPDSGNFDADTLFCDNWFSQYGWSKGQFGEADTLARAKGTSVDGVQHAGVIESGGGQVRLLKWEEYPTDWKPHTDSRTPIWEACHQMIRVLNQQGETAAGGLLAHMPEKGEPIRQLAYHLYTFCERKKWADEARAYNELIASWHAIVAASHETGHSDSQTELAF